MRVLLASFLLFLGACSTTSLVYCNNFYARYRVEAQSELGITEGEWEKGLRTSFVTWGIGLGLNW